MLKGKAVVVGAGMVGSTTAYTLMLSNMFSEICIIDINKDKAEGDALDMSHGIPFVKPVQISGGDYSQCADADIVIITAGAAQKPGETRVDLLNKNTAILKSIIDEVMRYCRSDVLLMMVTNPVDVLSYVAYKLSGLSKNQVIGSGTVLDTARLKYLIGEHTGVDTRNIHTYIIGEHGDTEVAAWSVTNIAGLPLEEYCRTCRSCDGHINMDHIHEQVIHAAYEIINKKGSTYYAIALAATRIAEAMLHDEHSILTVSTLLEGQYGINDVYLSVPCLMTEKGVSRVLEVPFDDNEVVNLRKSADAMKSLIKEIGF